MNLSGKLGVLVLCLFGVPFAGARLLALAQAIGLAHTATGNPPSGLLLLFGVLFSSVGFGLIFLAIYGGRCAQRQQRLQVEHPTEPFGTKTGRRAA